MVVHRTTCTSELPRANDVAELLALEGEDFRTAERIGETTAWNWQQGSLLQWVGQNPTTVVFNRRDGEHRFHARRLDIVSGNHEDLDRPLYAVSPVGDIGYSVDFIRIHFARRGYGYTVSDDLRRTLDPEAPVDDGLWRVDLASGRSELLVPLRRLVWTSPHPSMAGAFHWIDHVQPSRDGRHVAFLHRWLHQGGLFFSRLMVSDREADSLVCLVAGGSASHYDWEDERHIIGWFRPERAVNRLRMGSNAFRKVLRPLIALAWCDKVERGRRYNRGELRLAATGAVLARASGVFVERDPSHFERFRHWLAHEDARSAEGSEHEG